MHRLFLLLDTKPEIGIISSLSAAGLGFINIESMLKYSGMGLGILIGILTVYIKLIQAYKETRDIKNKVK